MLSGIQIYFLASIPAYIYILFWLSLRGQLHYVLFGLSYYVYEFEVLWVLGKKLKKIRVLHITSLILYAFQSSMSWDVIAKVEFSHAFV